MPLFLFNFLFLIFSCFLTYKAFVKSNEGIFYTNNNFIPIYIKLKENIYLNNFEFYYFLKDYLNNYNRIPPFVLSETPIDSVIQINIIINSINCIIQDIDKTKEKQLEEQEEFNKKYQEYLREKNWAILTKKELPKEPVKSYETTLYIIRQIKYFYSLQIIVMDNLKIITNDEINNFVTKEFVKEHKVLNLSSNNYFSFTPTGNPFVDFNAAILSAIANSIINSIENSSFSTNTDYASKEKEAFLLLKKTLYNSIFYDIINKIDPYFIKFSITDIYLIPINKQIDLYLKDNLLKINNINSIESYLLEKINYLDENDIAKIYFNLSIIYYANNNYEKAKYYYNKTKNLKINKETKNIIKIIIDILGTNFKQKIIS